MKSAALLLALLGCLLGVWAVEHHREVRGGWIATVTNIDWPSSPTAPAAQQQQELASYLDKAANELRLNTIYFQVRPEADALYASPIEPWSYWMTGKQGTNPGWDPLAFAVDRAHKNGLELHAWLNPYRGLQTAGGYLDPKHICMRHPEVCYNFNNQLWCDPGSEIVINNTYAVVMDIVSRYDVDGIHFDDYFYPYGITATTQFPDSATYAAYQAEGGTLSLDDWRRDNVNILISRLQEGLARIRPNVKFGVSPFGIWKAGHPPTINGLSSYDALFADSRLWLAKGMMDYLAPQLYWPTSAKNQSFPLLFEWWASVSHEDNLQYPRHMYTGNALYRYYEKNSPFTLEEYKYEVELTRDPKFKLSGSGSIFFSMKSFFTDASVLPYIAREIYPTPALPPVMQWKPCAKQQPDPALNLRFDASSQTLTWTAPVDGLVTKFIVYGPATSASSSSSVLAVLHVSTTSFKLGASASKGVYSVCSVTNCNVESAPVTITL